VAEPPVLNTHVHLPPNFSAFQTVEDAVATAAAQGVRVIGASNFHDLGVYPRFGAAARAAGILPLYGFELISLLADAEAQGARVNDPDNPGRAYLCAKGIPKPDLPREDAQRLLASSRAMNEARTVRMVGRLRDHLARAGLATDLDAEVIARDVAHRAGVPREQVVLQERHVAEAFQAALFGQKAVAERVAVLERAYGGPPRSAPDDALAVQGEMRSRLMKAGRPAFEPESPVSFEAAMELVLGLDAIPCYPILADGAEPVCEFEAGPDALAQQLLSRGIHAAELIPIRNRPEVVDTYVAALRRAGVVMMAGTEHNTRARIALEPRCVDGSAPSAATRDIFREGTCIVAAHQHLRASGRPGYVDPAGDLAGGFADGEARIRWFRELGEEVVAGRTTGLEA
jgi:hypothetical protein